MDYNSAREQMKIMAGMLTGRSVRAATDHCLYCGFACELALFFSKIRKISVSKSPESLAHKAVFKMTS
ncbi:hypothetical protein AB6T85_03040 [Erwinia sp. ACCC 02193]|uniref:Uncharacterized protein n=1 Tax=Erwinia aeris TaxID=3239803 RepID=A0ABV4E3C5_9GAMM